MIIPEFLISGCNPSCAIKMSTPHKTPHENIPPNIGLGGGCHWCTEAVFANLRGVLQVKQGFIASTSGDTSFSEAVIVNFDPKLINLTTLIEIHLHTHASTSNHKMRGKYRSAIYSFALDQHSQSMGILDDLRSTFSADLVTRVLPFCSFRASPEKYQRYFEKNADGPFCKAYIDPKLALLRKKFSKALPSNTDAKDEVY